MCLVCVGVPTMRAGAQVLQMLEHGVLNWEFDTLRLDELTGGQVHGHVHARIHERAPVRRVFMCYSQHPRAHAHMPCGPDKWRPLCGPPSIRPHSGHTRGSTSGLSQGLGYVDNPCQA